MDKRTIKKLELERIELTTEQQVLFNTELDHAYKTSLIEDWYLLTDSKYEKSWRYCVDVKEYGVYNKGYMSKLLLLAMDNEKLIRYINHEITSIKKNVVKRAAINNKKKMKVDIYTTKEHRLYAIDENNCFYYASLQHKICLIKPKYNENKTLFLDRCLQELTERGVSTLSIESMEWFEQLVVEFITQQRFVKEQLLKTIEV